MNVTPADGARYERWRSQWLAGTDSQAIATLRWHGVAAALALTAPLAPACGPCPPRPAASAAACPAAAISEAASQIRNVLRHPGGHPHA